MRQTIIGRYGRCGQCGQDFVCVFSRQRGCYGRSTDYLGSILRATLTKLQVRSICNLHYLKSNTIIMKRLITSAILFALLSLLSIWSLYNLRLPVAVPFITGLISLSMLALFCQLIENKLKSNS